MYAVIKTGGKQYRVAANDTITVEKLIGEAGEAVHFTDVLMVADGEKVEVGAPLVSGATVVGEIADQVKSPTVYIFKKRRRKHYRRRNGHRQLLTSVRITDILVGGAKPAAKAAAPKKAEAPKAAEPARVAETVKAARDTSHIVETVKGGTREATEHRVAKPVAGGHRTVEIEGDPNEGKDHILQTVRGEVKLAEGVKMDDISLIGGIGPKIEKALHEKGIKTWQQIADLKRFEIEKLNTELKLMGRIDREEWIEQAKELLAGKPPRAKTDRTRKDQE